MKRILSVAALLAASIACPALAQDAPARDFTGPRAEIFAGYDSLSEHASGSGDTRDGLIYGGAIGYDRQIGSVVLGAEAEVAGSTTRRTDGRALFTPGPATRSEAGRDLYLGVRAGVVATPGLLVYAKGGYTNARVTNAYDVTIQAIDESETLDGIRLGTGAEMQLTPRLYAKAEYRYSHYGESRYYDIDTDRHQLVAGIGLRF